MYSLTKDVFCYFCDLLTIPELIRLSRSSVQLDKFLSKDDSYWESRSKKEYGLTIQLSEDITWKNLYIHDMNIFTFGKNEYGQLGYASGSQLKPIQIPNFKFKDIAIYDHTVAIDLGDNVWVFGENISGQLGLGHKLPVDKPTQISHLITSSSEIIKCKAKQVSVGCSNTGIVDMDNNIWLCGHNAEGQLGLGDKQNRYVLTQVPHLITSKLEVIKCKAQQISIGDNYTVIIDMNNNVWTCGDNSFGQLGLGDYENRLTFEQIPGLKAQQIVAGSDYTIVIDLENNLFAFGRNDFGQSGLGLTGNINKPFQITGLKAKQVSTGFFHTLVVDMEDNMWSFGHNAYGQLGFAMNRKTERIPVKVPNLKVLSVIAGGYQSIIIDKENNIWSYGMCIGDSENNVSEPKQIPNIKGKKIAMGCRSVAIITKI